MEFIVVIKCPRGLLSAEDKLKDEFSTIISQTYATGPYRAAVSSTIQKPPSLNPISWTQSGSHCDQETATTRRLLLLLLAARPRGASCNLHQLHFAGTLHLNTPEAGWTMELLFMLLWGGGGGEDCNHGFQQKVAEARPSSLINLKLNSNCKAVWERNLKRYLSKCCSTENTLEGGWNEY